MSAAGLSQEIRAPDVKSLYSVRRMHPFQSALRQLLFALFAIDIALVVPLHSTIATIEARGGCQVEIAAAVPGTPVHFCTETSNSPSRPSPHAPLPRHDEATCALCAVAGHVLMSPAGMMPMDGVTVSAVVPSEVSKSFARTFAPLPARAPPTV